VPNKTPCGELCRYAWWDDRIEEWRCQADRGQSIAHARPTFLDEHNQCIMFAFDESAGAKKAVGGSRKKIELSPIKKGIKQGIATALRDASPTLTIGHPK
jgi:hypothetical protein